MQPVRTVLLESVVLDWFMVISCLFRWSVTCQNFAVNARNCAETTKIKSDILETLVILMPEIGDSESRIERFRISGKKKAHEFLTHKLFEKGS